MPPVHHYPFGNPIRPHSPWYFTPHQVPHTNLTTTFCSAHEEPTTESPNSHNFPSFPTVLPQGPNIPLGHYCYSPYHAGTRHWDRWVPLITLDPSPSQIPKYLWRILLQWTQTSLSSRWDRRKPPQEIVCRGDWKVPCHLVWICTCE